MVFRVREKTTTKLSGVNGKTKTIDMYIQVSEWAYEPFSKVSKSTRLYQNMAVCFGTKFRVNLITV